MNIPLLTVPQLAAALGLTPSTIYEWTRAIGPDSIPRYRLGRGYRFILTEVVEWIKTTRDGRRAGPPRRARRVPAERRRRPPNKALGGHQPKKAGRTRVSGDGPEAVARPLPSGTIEEV